MARVKRSGSGEYDEYVRTEWALFSANPRRAVAAHSILANTRVERVLDVGCGAGQELRPFLERSTALGVGVDLSPEVGRVGRELFAAEQPDSRLAFARARAEHVPFASSSFDVVICRLALPYTDNTAALGELARVLRPGGALLLTFHHARYYVDKLRAAIARRQFKSGVHACRVLLTGVLYHLTRHQPLGRFPGRETFQTMWMLRRELRRHGLAIDRVLEDSGPGAPSLLIRRS